MSTGPHHVGGTTPYPWPWCGLDLDALALLVVWAPADPRADTTDIARVSAEISAFSAALATYAVPTFIARTDAPLSRRRRLPAATSRPTWEAPHATTVETRSWDAFATTSLDHRLRSQARDHLLIAGWWTEIALHSTMRAANDRGYECLLLTDLTVGLEASTVAGAISSIHMSGGIFGATGTAASVLDALQEGNPSDH